MSGVQKKEKIHKKARMSTTPTPYKGDNRTTHDQSLMWEKKG